jgi:peptidoglycan/LPS O-acetylase OafA/YrhL
LPNRIAQPATGTLPGSPLAGGPRSNRIHALTSLRFFAALYVVVDHATPYYLPRMDPLSFWARWIEAGFSSVSFFFLLSGYILGVVYLVEDGTVPRKSFFQARFARIYPLFLLTLALDTPNFILRRMATFGWKIALLKTALVFCGKALMLQAWLPNLRGIDDPNWSLSVETFLYLCFPIAGVAVWKLRGRWLWTAALGMYLAGLAVSLVTFRTLPGDMGPHFPPIHIFIFTLGILLARWQSLRRSEAVQSARPSLSIVSLLGLAGLGAVMYLSPRVPNENLLDALLIPFFLYAIWAFSHGDWLPARLLSVPWLVALGEASFGLYLFHMPVLHWLMWLGWVHSTWILPLYLALSIGISLLSFYWFETPARRWLLQRQRAQVKETMEMASDAQ